MTAIVRVALPVTLIEMAAAGKIVVSTTHCDIPGVVEHEKTGWLATEASIDDLTAKLHTALQERERWPDMSRNARIKTEEQFNATTQASRLAGLYKGDPQSWVAPCSFVRIGTSSAMLVYCGLAVWFAGCMKRGGQ